MLNANDWNSIRVSLRKMNEIQLWRELGNQKVTVSTVCANNAWRVAMLVRVEYESHQPFLRWSQYYESAEEAKRNLDAFLLKKMR